MVELVAVVEAVVEHVPVVDHHLTKNSALRIEENRMDSSVVVVAEAVVLEHFLVTVPVDYQTDSKRVAAAAVVEIVTGASLDSEAGTFVESGVVEVGTFVEAEVAIVVAGVVASHFAWVVVEQNYGLVDEQGVTVVVVVA